MAFSFPLRNMDKVMVRVRVEAWGVGNRGAVSGITPSEENIFPGLNVYINGTRGFELSAHPSNSA